MTLIVFPILFPATVVPELAPRPLKSIDNSVSSSEAMTVNPVANALKEDS